MRTIEEQYTAKVKHLQLKFKRKLDKEIKRIKQELEAEFNKRVKTLREMRNYCKKEELKELIKVEYIRPIFLIGDKVSYENKYLDKKITSTIVKMLPNTIFLADGSRFSRATLKERGGSGELIT